jgi:hypothetical protein
VFLWLAAGTAIATAWPLVRGFRAFDREASAIHTLEEWCGDRPMIMGLVFEPRSKVVNHPVFLHAAATIARRRGGVPNYSLAGWRQAPIRYKTAPPPTFPSEWRPDLFDYAAHGAAYDHFLGVGLSPDSIFGGRLGADLRVAGRSGEFWLVRRR